MFKVSDTGAMKRVASYLVRPLTSKQFCTNSPSHLLMVGDKAELSKRFSYEDVEVFARLTGDTNPIHLDEQYAKQTRFKKRLVHGTLCMGLLSGVLGSVLPGPGTIMLSCHLEYPSPLYIGEEVTAEVTVKTIEGRRVTFSLKCTVDSPAKIVCEGTSELLVPKRRISNR